jgi:hypothetical protein
MRKRAKKDIKEKLRKFLKASKNSLLSFLFLTADINLFSAKFALKKWFYGCFSSEIDGL